MPLQVFAIAIVITLIFKKSVEFEDYGPEVVLGDDMFLQTPTFIIVRKGWKCALIC